MSDINAQIPDLSNNYHISGHNKNCTTTYLLTKEHISMFVVNSIVIQIKGQSMDISNVTKILRVTIPMPSHVN
jgi:hypothetical protein